MSEIPPILPYSRPTPPPDPSYSRLARFSIAFFLGIVLSTMVWVGGWKWVNEGSGAPMLFVIPGLKVAVFIIRMFMRRRRNAGAGMLASIPIVCNLLWRLGCQLPSQVNHV